LYTRAAFSFAAVAVGDSTIGESTQSDASTFGGEPMRLDGERARGEDSVDPGRLLGERGGRVHPAGFR